MKVFFKLLKQLLILLVVAFIVFYFWASSSTLDEKEYAKITTSNVQTVDSDSIYRIVTYNIGYLSGMTNNLAVKPPKSLFDENLKKVLTEIKSVDPDIIAFQEIDFNAKRSFEVNQHKEIVGLGYTNDASVVNWDKSYLPFPYWPPSVHYGKVVSGQSIVSKYPLKNHQRVVLERVADAPFYREAFYLDRLLQMTTVTIESKDIILMNVHLEAFEKETRANQLRTVIEEFKKQSTTHPVILLGDFNSDPNYKNPVIEQLLSMIGVGTATFSKGDYKKTYDTKNPSERLDYIFYTQKDFEYISGKVLEQFGQISDHLPVEMSFKLKD